MRQITTSIIKISFCICLLLTVGCTEPTTAIEPTKNDTIVADKKVKLTNSSATKSKKPTVAKKSLSVAKPVKKSSPTAKSEKKTASKSKAKSTTRSSLVADAQGVYNVNFDDFKFPIEKDQAFDRKLLTKRIESLVGKKIRIRGFMHPMVFKKTGIKQFIFVRDNQECCFGPGAALFDCMAVLMNQGKSANFSTRPITIEGKFDIKVLKRRGVDRACFLLRADSAK